MTFTPPYKTILFSKPPLNGAALRVLAWYATSALALWTTQTWEQSTVPQDLWTAIAHDDGKYSRLTLSAWFSQRIQTVPWWLQESIILTFHMPFSKQSLKEKSRKTRGSEKNVIYDTTAAKKKSPLCVMCPCVYTTSPSFYSVEKQFRSEHVVRIVYHTDIVFQNSPAVFVKLTHPRHRSHSDRNMILFVSTGIIWLQRAKLVFWISCKGLALCSRYKSGVMSEHLISPQKSRKLLRKRITQIINTLLLGCQRALATCPLLQHITQRKILCFPHFPEHALRHAKTNGVLPQANRPVNYHDKSNTYHLWAMAGTCTLYRYTTTSSWMPSHCELFFGQYLSGCSSLPLSPTVKHRTVIQEAIDWIWQEFIRRICLLRAGRTEVCRQDWQTNQMVRVYLNRNHSFASSNKLH